MLMNTPLVTLLVLVDGKASGENVLDAESPG